MTEEAASAWLSAGERQKGIEDYPRFAVSGYVLRPILNRHTGYSFDGLETASAFCLP
jgi:hypothetical protein